MTGLEKIVEQISQEAQAASEEKLAQTRKEADEILADAKRKRESSFAISKKQVEEEAKQLLLRGKSAADLQEKKLLLQAKQQMIQEIFDDALDTMLHLEQKEYFELLLHMVDRYAQPGNGSIHLSRKDLDRMPESFLEELKSRQITISEEPAQLKGGFLLSYGDILENCSFDALLAANRESLQDQIVRLIF